MLIVKRIRVRYRLGVEAENEDAARRAHDVHAQRCPIYRTISGCVDITTELELVVTAEG